MTIFLTVGLIKEMMYSYYIKMSEYFSETFYHFGENLKMNCFDLIMRKKNRFKKSNRISYI